jgi:hypothetical protein
MPKLTSGKIAKMCGHTPKWAHDQFRAKRVPGQKRTKGGWYYVQQSEAFDLWVKRMRGEPAGMESLIAEINRREMVYREKEESLLEMVNSLVTAAVEQGQRLARARAILQSRELWQEWLRVHTRFGLKSADAYIRIAKDRAEGEDVLKLAERVMRIDSK